ncbi:MAG: hypothetical protein ABI824_17415 [Acidobacteriota bacterium]
MSRQGTWVSQPGLILAALIFMGIGVQAQSAAPANESPFEAEQRLRSSANSAPNNVAYQRAYAEFLEYYRSKDARAAYAKLVDALSRENAPASERAAAAEKLAMLDLQAGDRNAAALHLAAYNAAGGTSLVLPNRAPLVSSESVEIPGPLRSFARMTAISSDLARDEVLPALARAVVNNGYRARSVGEGLEQTEYLSLVLRYLTQARELEALSGASKIIRITQCDSNETGVLLRVIGYRMRGGCGADVVLETINASRAFLTTDSGFPLGELELALRTNRPFVLDYHPTQLPLIYTRAYWQPLKEQTDQPFIDYFISDPSLARLYVGLSKIDPETADDLKATMPVARFKLFAHVLDFYGAMFRVRNGKAIVPGGARTERAWEKLNGASPEKGAAFFERMLIQDDGWLASYYDALARIHGPVQTYLLDPDRVQRFYEAIRGKVTTPGPARPVFRSNTDMLLLTTRLRIDPDGKPHLPGGLDTWKHLFSDPPKGSKVDGKIKKDASNWKDPDQVLEALFGLSRKLAENEHLKIFMALTDLDRRRTQPLEPAVVEQLARRYGDMNAQYPILSEAPALHGQTMLSFLDTAEKLGEIRNMTRRSDALGLFQGLTGLWQIFLRQGVLPQDQADATLTAIVAGFANQDNDRQLFDAGRAGVQTLLRATKAPVQGPAQAGRMQDQMMDLLAGTKAPSGSNAYQQMARDLIRVFEAQRLLSLDTLFDLADNLEAGSKGQSMNAALAGRLANRIAEIQLPQGDLTRAEKNLNAYGYWADKHVDDQRKFNLRRDIEKAGTNAQELADLRGALTPFLRDTIVGFNYMHYAPPGAQILHTNPLFVRSHDFVGYANSSRAWGTTEVYGSGWPRNAGGRLTGSLSGLPYALAQAEQNFLVPTKTQALIWNDLVPQMMLTAVIPRFWNVSQDQVHWVGLHMAYGESLLAEAALSPQRKAKVLDALDLHLSPRRLKTVDDDLSAGDVAGALDNVLPSELYLLARNLATSEPGANSTFAAEIKRMSTANAHELSDEMISRAFGTPKPMLANSYEPELLNLRTFPTLMGYSTRILAESWESNLLYYAALADQIHAGPGDLNVLVPEWTQLTVENIFATHLEDWPALWRSLRVVGDKVRKEANAQAVAGTVGYAPGGEAQ